jgi:hypothetical protein
MGMARVGSGLSGMGVEFEVGRAVLFEVGRAVLFEGKGGVV